MKRFTQILVFGMFGLAGASISSAQVLDDVREIIERPEPAGVGVPDDLRDVIREYREEQHALVEERRQLAETLRNATAEERQAAIAAFREENAGRVALQRALAEQLREELKELRSERPDRPERPTPERPQVTNEVAEIMKNFRETRQELINERKAILESVKDASKEEREAAILEIRERQRDQVAAQKELAKQVRDSLKELRESRRDRSNR